MTQQSIWQEDTEVRTYETSFQGVWKPAAFFRAMEEATVHHAANLKTDYFTLQQFDLAWVLARSKIRFSHFPSAGTKVIVKTWPKGWQQKIFGMRDFTLCGLDGGVFAQATTAWLLINTKTRRFVKPELLPTPLPDNNGLSAVNEPLEKLVHPAEMQEMRTFTASYSTLDLLGHVNNTHYIDWIFDCFSIEQIRGRKLDWLQINYSSEVKPDEQITISIAELPEKPLTYSVVGINRNSEVTAFDAQFGLIEK